MQEQEGGSRGVDAWREATGRALALLAPFAQVRLTLRLPPDAFDSALYRNFPLRDDEHLVAVIDCGKGNPDGFCALTTHRIYWPVAEESGGASPSDDRDGTRNSRAGPRTVPPDGGPDLFASVSITASAGMAGSGSGAVVDANPPANGHAPSCRWVDYASLPGDLGRDGPEPDSDRLALGGGQTLTLRGADPRLIPALGRYLAIMGAGARTARIATGPGAADVSPTPARKRAVPVAAMRRRISPSDLLEFRRALDAATRLVVATPIMIVACVAVFAAMVISGVPVFQPSSAQLIDWGANDGARVILRHDFWRLAASVFVHGGLIHLVVNMWSLIVIGPLIERIYGPAAFAAIYLSSGIGGALASALIPPIRVSVGASGAICGILGALTAFLIVNRRTIPPTVLKLLRDNLVGIVAFMVVLGVVVPNIDHSAHLGGLGTGFVSGLLLGRFWPVVPSRWVAARRLAMITAIAGGLGGIAVAATRWAEASVPPERRLDDFLDQIRMPYDEFFSIKRAISAVGGDANRDHDAAAEEEASRKLRELAARGGANLDRLRLVKTTDAELHAMSDALIRAQTGQIHLIEVLGRFVESGGAKSAEVPAAADAMNRPMREFEQRHLAYRRRHGLRSLGRER